MKKNLLLMTGVVLLMSACSSQKQASGNVSSNSSSNSTGSSDLSSATMLSSAEQSEGFKLLFDGKSKNGWHSYGRSEAGQAWQVANGTLFYDTTQRQGRSMIGGGDLVTNNEYENFHLKYEWKVAPKSNSGLIFLIHEDTAMYQQTYFTGLEMQVLDNDGHPDGKITKHRAGDLYDLIKSSSEPVKPVGEWNLAEVKMDHGKLDLYLNGTNVVSTTIGDEAWNQLVANSKFKSMSGFAKYKRGKISLQDHGNLIWYRNIRIKEL